MLLASLGLLILGHHVLELRPQRLHGRELVADGDDRFERAVQLVDVGEDLLEALGGERSAAVEERVAILVKSSPWLSHR